jgi:hypothetical protein
MLKNRAVMTFVLLGAGCVCAAGQNPTEEQRQQEAIKRQGGALWKLAHEVYLKDFHRSYSEATMPLIRDVSFVGRELLKLHPERAVRYKHGFTVPKAGIGFKFSVTVSRGPETHTDYAALVEVHTFASFKEAEEQYAWRLATLQAVFVPGTFSGRKIGELAARSTRSGDSALYFLRRNVWVVVLYAGLMEIENYRDRTDVTKSTIRRRIRDDTVPDKCEELAMMIDDLLVAAK